MNDQILLTMSLGLAYGLLEVKEVIEWADAQITNSEEPGDLLIELSISGSKNAKNLSRDLANAVVDADYFASFGHVLGRIAHQIERGKQDSREMASKLYYTEGN